ncbi:SHOCT domain-containing protein [Erysipelothrix sp. HDW6C]|uniref:SHOCT domain-containing protein n=1 Tax=Erysipelothrix sp. HDW6C TaxID=2714930 RepID=UPI001409B234|nr:SHOCT domain-containing protein [Erysipelothrix sp. HDW6C]QIK70826.1 SHOCT domain-containing protein [Erysipelothrix sp. HDW6C]
MENISSKTDNFAFSIYMGFKNKILKKLPTSEQPLYYFYGGVINSKSKKVPTMFVITNDNLYYMSPQPFATLGSVSLSSISNMRIDTKSDGSHLIVELAGSVVDFVFTGIGTPNKVIEKISEVKSTPTNHNGSGAVVSNLAQIKELKELLDIGAITQEEFDLKKSQLLDI